MSVLTVLSLLAMATVLCNPTTGQVVAIRPGSCPKFWSPFSGRCYKYVATHADWAKAELHCLSEGGNLASVHSLKEFNFIQSLIESFDHAQGATWVGLSDRHQEGSWMWTDGSNVTFTQWDEKQPDNFLFWEEDCVYTNYNLRWNDGRCSDTYPFVCASRVVCP